MNMYRRSITACVLLFALPFACFAQDGAILYPGDGATLNGKALPTTSAVLGGDRIQTGKTAAQIIQTGSTVQIEAATLLQYGTPLQLGCGAVTVDGTATVTANETHVVPSGRASYAVVNRGGRLLISVKSGNIMVGNESLGAGQAIARPGTGGCEEPTAAPAAAAKSNGKLLGIIGAGAAAGVAGGVLARRGDKGPVSPSRP